MRNNKSLVTSSIVMLGVAVVLTGCSGSSERRIFGKDDPSQKYSPRVTPLGMPVPKGGGYRKLGKPYTVKGITYVPRHEPGYDRVGIASWYGEDFHGRLTANGEVYDSDALLARYPKAAIGDFDGDPNKVTELDALVAYLQMLGTLVDFTNYDPEADFR